MPDRRSIPPPPRGYTAAERKLWRDAHVGWDLDPLAVPILDSGLRQHKLWRKAERLMELEGIVIRDRFGQSKPHPASTIARDAHAGFLRAMKALNLDLEPLHDRPGRPPGRNTT